DLYCPGPCGTAPDLKVGPTFLNGRAYFFARDARHGVTDSSMILTIAAGYLIGSIPFALILSRRWGTSDLRRIGRRNIGAANVLRASGITAGVLVAILDITKGAASVILAERLNPSSPVSAAAGLAAIVGHVYPVWLRFRGGKGVATACGVFSVLTPWA